jgi:hypothetical protein
LVEIGQSKKSFLMKLLGEPECIDLTLELDIQNVESFQTGFFLFLTFKRNTKEWFISL